MFKKFLRQTPFGIFLVTISTIIFFITTSLVSNGKTVTTVELLNSAQSGRGLIFFTTLLVNALLLEILLRKLERHSTKAVNYTKSLSLNAKYWTKPMGLDEQSVSFKSLARVFNQNFSTNLRFIDNQIFKRLSL